MSVAQTLAELVGRHGLLVAEWLPDGTLRSVNGAYAALLNLHPDRLKGASFLEAFPAESRAAILGPGQELSPAAPTRRVVRRFEAVGGTTTWHEWIDHGIFGSRGALEGLVSVGMSVEGGGGSGGDLRHRRMQHVMKMISSPPEREEDLILLALEGMVEITGSTGGYLHTFDPDTQQVRLTAWSQGVVEVCRVTPGVHYPLADAGIWADAIRTGAPVVHNDYQGAVDRRGLPEGHFHLTRHLAVPVLDNGHPAAVAGVGNKVAPYDEDDVRQLTLYLETAWQLLKRREVQARLSHAERVQAVGRLAGGIAHDFNNVLTVIALNVRLLEDETGEPLSAEQRLLVEEIRIAAANGADTVRQLMGLSRREAALTMIPFDLAGLLQDFGALLVRLLPATIEVEIDGPSEGLVVVGDGGGIQQALMNLTNNACDAMNREGKLSLRLRAREGCRGHAPAAVLEVADTGSGMAPEVLRRATEPFFTTKAVGEGTGLGLAMVAGVIERHGGTLDFESTEGQGTRVVLTLPTVRGAQPPPAAGVTESRPPGSVYPGVTTILVVDDELGIRRAAARVLQRDGFVVLLADSATTAMRLVGEDGIRPDLVLTDLIMPGPSGAELAGWLLGQFPGIPIVIMSGHSRGEYGAVTEELGDQVHYLAKPWVTADLRHVIDDLLRKRRRRA